VSLDTGRVGVVLAHTTGVIGVDDVIDEVVAEPVVQVDEQLTDLLVLSHRVDGALYPSDRFRVQSVGSGGQPDAWLPIGSCRLLHSR
jgi:hypothetical protein